MRLYCGDSLLALEPSTIVGLTSAKLVNQQALELKQCVGATSLIMLKQVHGADGLIIETAEQAKKYKQLSFVGDYSITAVPDVGLVVFTADCLPVIVYDKIHNVIGAAHVGWQGAVKEVVKKMLERMHILYGMQPHNLEVFFGPSALSCCYEIQKDFLKNLEQFSYAPVCLQERDGKLFFDNRELVFQQLIASGIAPEAIKKEYSACTIHNKQFCSYRRNPLSNLRQATVVSIQKY